MYYYALVHPLFSDDISEEKRLIRAVLEEYQKTTLHGRPVRDISHPVQVKFGLGLIQMELDEKDKVLSVSIWSRFVSPFYLIAVSRFTLSPLRMLGNVRGGHLLPSGVQPRAIIMTSRERP